MTPTERTMLHDFLARLAQAPAQAKDAEAESVIRDGLARQPDLTYLLAQTALLQDVALKNAAARITDLERQVAQSASAAPAQGSFLGGAALGPWGARPTAPAQPPVYAQPTAYAQPVAAATPSLFGGSGPVAGGFLRNAASTALGFAGGAMLFQGLENLLGHGGGWGGGGGLGQAARVEDVTVNNYYDQPAGQLPDGQPDDGGGYAPGADPGYDNVADVPDDGSGFDDVTDV